MNEELAKALAQLKALGATPGEMQAYLAAHDVQGHKGVPFVDAKPDTSETLGDRMAGALSSGYQGMTLGAGNKITAGIRTVLPEKIGGTKGFDFPTALREQTDVLDQHRRNHRGESFGMEVAGGLPSLAVSGGLKAVQAGSKLARVALTMGKGAAIGAGAGAAEAIRPDATMGDVGKGAAIGGALGTALSPAPAIVRGIPSAVRAVKSAPGTALSLVRDGAGAISGNPMAKLRLAGRAAKYIGREVEAPGALPRGLTLREDAAEAVRPRRSAPPPRGTSPISRPKGLSRTPQDDLPSAAAAIDPEYKGAWFKPPSVSGHGTLEDAIKGQPQASATTLEEAVAAPAKASKQRGAPRARLNADAERMGLEPGPPPPQGRVREPDAPDAGVDLLEALKGFPKGGRTPSGGTPKGAPGESLDLSDILRMNTELGGGRDVLFRLRDMKAGKRP